MSAVRVTVLAITLLCSVCHVKSQTCDNMVQTLMIPKLFAHFVKPVNGASLNKCTFNGQQCCRQFIINVFDGAMKLAINNGSLHFTRGFTEAQKAVDKMRNDINGYLNNLKEDIIKPLLLSAVPSPTSDFHSAVNHAMTDIDKALNSSKVNLKVTFRKYIKAIAVAYFDKAVAHLNKEIKKKFDSLPVPITVPVINVNSHLASCGAEALFNQIYGTTASAVQLIDLLQNITRAIGIIRQLPPRFDKLLQTVSKFKFSDTCLDVFTTNYLCPLCRDQPLMCPGRCAEVVTGCVSPLHQSTVQLDASLKMILSIVKGLIGTSDSVTNSVNVHRIPVLFKSLMASIQKLDFLEFNFISKLVSSCGVTVPTLPPITLPTVTLPFTLPFTIPTVTVPTVTVPRITLPPVTVPQITLPPATVPRITLPPATVPRITLPPATVPRITLPPATVPRPPWPFGKRSLMADKAMVNRRALNFEIPQLKTGVNFEIPSIDTSGLSSKLKELEEQIDSSLGGNKIESVTEELCSPDFSVQFSGITFKTTAANGMCSYGAGNTGNYSSTFKKKDIIDQAYGNPAGHFNYNQLLNQAKEQTYVLTELFRETDIHKSVFSVFMPGTTLPTTEFWSALPPSNPNPTTSTPVSNIHPTDVATTASDPNPTTSTPANNIRPTDVAITDSSSNNATSAPTGLYNSVCTLQRLIGTVHHKYSKQRTKLIFKFSTKSSDASFECKLDHKRFHPCKSPVVWKRLRNGSHVVTVRASCTVDDETWSVEKSFTFHV